MKLAKNTKTLLFFINLLFIFSQNSFAMSVDWGSNEPEVKLIDKPIALTYEYECEYGQYIRNAVCINDTSFPYESICKKFEIDKTLFKTFFNKKSKIELYSINGKDTPVDLLKKYLIYTHSINLGNYDFDLGADFLPGNKMFSIDSLKKVIDNKKLVVYFDRSEFSDNDKI